MFSAVVRNGLRRTAMTGVRHQSTKQGTMVPANVLTGWYNIFGKSTGAYASWLIIGILVAEGITGSAGDMIWKSVNKGKTYETVDWTKFAVEDDDDDEDDDEEEEEEEDDDDDDDDE
mmetsp:Transcript_23497/g.32811  ORF Transcript_23497/g.32811 Transcript_23497/m.32811 type:complete len:117 (+) Transcript_23497:105-455(+)